MADDWERSVHKTEDACAGCGRPLWEEDEIVASLVLGEQGLRREDHCCACFSALSGEPFSFWRFRKPELLRKRPRKLDLAYLTQVFKSLDSSREEHALKVAWITGLLLLRKRILKLEGRETRDGREVLVLRMAREDRVFHVLDPQLTQEAIASLHVDLARIFNLDEEGAQDGPAGD